MSSMTTLRDIVNGDPADATDVEFNFNTIESYIASDVVVADGTQAFTAAQTGVAGTASTHLATKGQVDAVLPVGMITAFGGAAAPTGWALCNGASVSSTDPTYVDLFAVIGTTYGDPGSGNFNLPDFRDRTLVGASGTKANGSTGGRSDWELLQHTHTQDSHTHTQPQHRHTMPTHSHSVTGSVGGSDGTHSHSDNFNVNGPTTGTVAVGSTYSGSSFVIPHKNDTNVFPGGVYNGGLAIAAISYYGTDVNVSGAVITSGGHGHSFSLTAADKDPGDTHYTTPTNNPTTAVNQDAGTETVTADQNWAPYQATNFIIKL